MPQVPIFIANMLRGVVNSRSLHADKEWGGRLSGLAHEYEAQGGGT